MEKLIFPGHIGKLEYIMPALQVYVEADDWVKTADYIDKEFAILKANGIESEMKDDKTDYTKDAELPRYFGFVERRTPGDVKSDCRITELGRLFYDAVKDKKQEDINEAVMTAFETVTFGKNNEGCPGSNTRLEAPNILLIASLMLDGVTRQEYAGILYEMLNNNAPIVNALVRIKLCREKNLPIANKVRVDNKVVPFLVNVGFLMEDGSYIKLNPQVRDDYQDRITKLPTTNDLENIFPEDDMKIIKFDDEPRQLIFYGAPGTGKSHEINVVTEGQSVIRTTFHPDSDYSTFVGSYKPTMGLLPICDELGQPMKIGSTVLHKEQIIYEFVDQAFLQAYVQAWKYYAENSDDAKRQYLVIEEINRGNCAQIFGDLFQLLDRNDYGFSVYPINADKDMKKQLAKAFKKDGKTITIENADKINTLYKGKDVVSQVLSGDILLLPNNLYIWATMNTSDQSLFPIDSAFKRRWEWQYMPIDKGYDESGNEIKWAIEGATKKYSWWSFLEKINAQIGEATQSEDKKLGFFFCKASDGVISAEKFVGKVIFYLWNDVFKNNGFEGHIFKDVDGTELSFSKFYESDTKGNAIVQKDKVKVFLNNLGVEEINDGTIPTEDPEEDEDGNEVSAPLTGRDYTKFSVNGVGRYAKNNLASECVKKYIELNPSKSADEVINDWLSLSNIVPHFIESKEQYDARTDNSKRSHEIPCGDTVIYVAHDGYGSNDKALVLKDAVNKKNWGITVDKA